MYCLFQVTPQHLNGIKTRALTFPGLAHSPQFLVLSGFGGYRWFYMLLKDPLIHGRVDGGLNDGEPGPAAAKYPQTMTPPPPCFCFLPNAFWCPKNTILKVAIFAYVLSGKL